MLTATGADVPGCGRTLGPVESHVLKSDTDGDEPRRTWAGRSLNPKVPGSSSGAGTTTVAARVAKLLLNSVLGAKTGREFGPALVPGQLARSEAGPTEPSDRVRPEFGHAEASRGGDLTELVSLRLLQAGKGNRRACSQARRRLSCDLLTSQVATC